MNKLKQEFELYERNRRWDQLFQETRWAESQIQNASVEASRQENAQLNRYMDVYPFDCNRVQINRLTNNYINASFVTIELVDQPYILTQGPLPNTVDHFWSMVWEQKSKAIVMLNRLIERNQIKCHQYWPDSNQTELDLTTELALKVNYVSEIASQHYTVRNLILTDTQTGEQRTILHFHYLSWPDFGIPATAADFIDFLYAVRNSQALDKNQHGPAIVHCSAGIGRSGTFCLVDSALRHFEKTSSLDTKVINDMLLNMRKNRRGCVQTCEQYRFCFLALIHAIEKSTQYQASKRLENGVQSKSSESSEIESSHFFRGQSEFGTGQTQSVTKPEAESVESTQELRKRAREERKEKTLEQIKRIKDHSKEVDRAHLRTVIVKYSGVLLAASFLIGAGVFITRIS